VADDVKRTIDELATDLRRHRDYLARERKIKQVWDRWYDEGDRLSEDLLRVADVDAHRTEVRTANLPERTIADEHYVDDERSRIHRVEALHRSRDRRAVPVLIAALSDTPCVASAARALRDIRSDDAVPALLGAAALAPLGTNAFREISKTLQSYKVSPQRIRQAFDAETSPQGRVSLRRLLGDDQLDVRDDLVVLATDDYDPVTRNAALGELGLSEVEVVRAAIPLAVHDLTVRLRLRRMHRQRGEATVDEAVETALTTEPPLSDAAELDLLLRLAQQIAFGHGRDPMRLIRVLHGLTTHPQVGERARKALCQGNVVFDQMMQQDDALREEARSLFRSVATRPDLDRFARELAAARSSRGFRARFDRRYRP
jgi:PBS lyase HEAT-like repeat-containing protein